MGWSSIYTGRLTSQEKKQRIDRVRTWENEEVVKSCMVGTTYYAAVRRKDDGAVYAVVALTQLEEGEFGFKDISEICGPVEEKCPVGILKLLSPTDDKLAQEWRKRCLENHEAQLRLRRLKKTSLTGFIIKTAQGYVSKITKVHLFLGDSYFVWPTKEEAEKMVSELIDLGHGELSPTVCEVKRLSPSSPWVLTNIGHDVTGGSVV
jgi:hypothetical protein